MHLVIVETALYYTILPSLSSLSRISVGGLLWEMLFPTTAATPMLVISRTMRTRCQSLGVCICGCKGCVKFTFGCRGMYNVPYNEAIFKMYRPTIKYSSLVTWHSGPCASLNHPSSADEAWNTFYTFDDVVHCLHLTASIIPPNCGTIVYLYHVILTKGCIM